MAEQIKAVKKLNGYILYSLKNKKGTSFFIENPKDKEVYSGTDKDKVLAKLEAFAGKDDSKKSGKGKSESSEKKSKKEAKTEVTKINGIVITKEVESWFRKLAREEAVNIVTTAGKAIENAGKPKEKSPATLKKIAAGIKKIASPTAIIAEAKPVAEAKPTEGKDLANPVVEAKQEVKSVGDVTSPATDKKASVGKDAKNSALELSDEEKAKLSKLAAKTNGKLTHSKNNK